MTATSTASGACVTGGASGIGLATARAARRAGRARGGARPDPGGVRSRCIGVAVRRDRRRVGAGGGRRGRARLGGLDMLVNNAGIGAQGTVEDNDDDEWRRVLDVNVVGMVRMARAALPHLRESPAAAAIVNTCSVAATAGLPQRALYSATKGARARADAGDGGRPRRARASASTASTRARPTRRGSARLLDAADDPEAERAALEARQPMGRLGQRRGGRRRRSPTWPPRVGSTTGTALAVDGGMHGLRLRSRS